MRPIITITLTALIGAAIWLAGTSDHSAHAQSNQQCADFSSFNVRVCVSPLGGVSATPTPPPATVTPTGTPTPASGPDCTDHNATRWHGLQNAAKTCTYGHTHQDNPHQLDSVFGLLQYGEVSYPWMTASENAEAGKHRFYGWTVVDLPDCSSNDGIPYGFRRWRLEAHKDSNAGALTRFHSFFLQAELCSPTDPTYKGMVSFGGHMDYGSLYLLEGSREVYYPTTGDDGGQGVNRRIHGSPGTPRSDWTWYGHHAWMGVGLREEDWGPVDPMNLSRQLFYGGAANHSWQEPGHVMSVFTPYTELSGFANRYGQPVAAGCTVGPDCVPYSFVNVKPGTLHSFRADTLGLPTREYDVNGPDGLSLIRFPN